jgi:hypothetical protein
VRLAILLLIAVSASAQTPPLEKLSGYGCDLHGSGESWTLEVWAAHGGERDWKFVASANSSLAKSLTRCNQFMRAVEKKAKAEPKR